MHAFPSPVTALRIVPARDGDLDRFIGLLEEVADWLHARGIHQWQPGSFRVSAEFYQASIRQGEIHLVVVGEALAGGLRLTRQDPVVWPDVPGDDALYVYNLAVRRAWANQGLGRRILEWTEAKAGSLGKACLRLDCMAHNGVLREYYRRAGFEARGEVDAHFPAPVGTLRLMRYEKRVTGAAIP